MCGGKIALIRSKSDLVVGTCILIEVKGPLTREEFQRNAARAGLTAKQAKTLPYPETYAWVVKNARKCSPPRPYRHPMGAVVWVKLPEFK
jgi:hypothetical protein